VCRASWAVDLGLLCRSINVMVYVREYEVSVMCGHGISLECMLFYLRNNVGVEITLDGSAISLWGGSGVL